MLKLGEKIVIVGISASGKSTFARKLAGKLRVPTFHVDSLMWKPRWDYVGDEETTRRLNSASAGEDWIIEGYITKGARDCVFGRADSIIFLDYSSVRAGWWYLKRSWKHRKSARPELEGSPDTFTFIFLWRILRKKELQSLTQYVNDPSHKGKVLRLRSPREAGVFLKSI